MDMGLATGGQAERLNWKGATFTMRAGHAGSGVELQEETGARAIGYRFFARTMGWDAFFAALPRKWAGLC